MAAGSNARRVRSIGLLSVVGGVLLAGMALPVLGGLGLAAKSVMDDFQRLPGYLQINPLPAVSRIVTSNGQLLADFYYQDRIPEKLADIPPVMRTAQVAIEDSRFYENRGIDIRSILRAMLHNAAGSGGLQGASTITEQYVKNILIENAKTPAQLQAATADTLARKIREAKYALELDRRMSKDQILEGYLNIAYYGDGAWGVGAAAEHYFGIPVQRINLPQAALLAGLVQDPYLYDPVIYPSNAIQRRNIVLARMLQLHDITQAQYQKALATPLRLHVQQQQDGCQASRAPYFCDYVLAELQHDPALGRTSQDRTARLLRGGLTVVTTLDPKMQAAAQNAVDTQVGMGNKFADTIAMVQPGTGHIAAIAENRRYGSGRGETTVDYATDEAYGGSLGFQTGSAFKIFVLAAALKEHIPLSLTLHAPPVITVSGFTACGTNYQFPPYTVHNAEAAEGGVFNIPQATWASVNTFYIQLELRTGLCLPAEIAQSMGVRQADGQPLQRIPSMVLGTNDISPLDMAGAAATLAAQGRYCPVTAIERIETPNGRALPGPPLACHQVLPPGLADTESQVLTGVLGPGGTAGAHPLNRPAAGKTGTTDNFVSAWFVGYTPNLAAAVAMADPSGGSANPLQNVTFHGTFYPAVYGGTVPAATWQQAMTQALAGVPPTPFPPASALYANGLTVTVPDVAGQSPAKAVAELDKLGLSASVQSGQVASTEPAGSVAGTSPPAGARVSSGSAIVVLVSNGHPPPPPSSSPPGSSPPSVGPPSPGHKKHH
jgi:membrane peptidoglycan carboxypeptidase